jgi:hypothetical protein
MTPKPDVRETGSSSLPRSALTMIVRIWRGQSIGKDADAYRQHVTKHVFPTLSAIAGHAGAYLLERSVGPSTEFLAVTLWDSIEAVKQFAGIDPDIAIVEPAARAVLADFDDFVRHYEVSDRSYCGASRAVGLSSAQKWFKSPRRALLPPPLVAHTRLPR